MTAADAATVQEPQVRAGCQGIPPLTGHLAPWQVDLCGRPSTLGRLVATHGSPVNIHELTVFARNVAELEDAAHRTGVRLRMFYARKANKCIAFVDAARELGLGVDVASEQELSQAIDRDIDPWDVMVTAAVKPRTLLERCVASGVTVVVDNHDEIRALVAAALRADRRVPVAVRLAASGVRPTRFGTPTGEILALLEHEWDAGGSARSALDVVGVHFHLDGYSPEDRVRALGEALALTDAMTALGHRPRFVDIGGGIPMSYLDSREEWEEFWRRHRRAVLGEEPPLTYLGHGLGLVTALGQIVGKENVYPYHQQPVRGEWLTLILDARIAVARRETSVAEALRTRDLELRMEPGRAVLDGCGMTIARVEFRKRHVDGHWLIGVAMNRTQCRSTSDDFLVDPLLLPTGEPVPGDEAGEGPIEGFLVGAYCIERELLTWRRMRFPGGVRVGDLVVFPNTAGYQMHILESRSHQMPLARNLVATADGRFAPDQIDAISG